MSKMLSRGALEKRQAVLCRKPHKARASRCIAAGALFLALLDRASIASASAAPSAGSYELGSLQTLHTTIDMLMTLLVGVGVCFLAYGVVALAMSFQSHDDSQKNKAILCMVGGGIAASVHAIVPVIAPQAQQWIP